MSSDSTLTAAFLEMAARLTGRRIVDIVRVFYVFRGELDRGDGALEIACSELEPIVFDVGHDGEKLRITWGPWDDPFPEGMTAEERGIVEREGKWTRCPVSHEAEYGRFLGAAIRAVRPIRNQFGQIAGVQIETEPGELIFVVGGDESYVLESIPEDYAVVSLESFES